MTIHTLDATTLIEEMSEKPERIEDALDYAVCAALVSYSRQEAAGQFRVGDMLAVGPHTFLLEAAGSLGDEWDERDLHTCQWRNCANRFVTSVTLSPDETHFIEFLDDDYNHIDPDLYEVRDGRLLRFVEGDPTGVPA